MFHSVFAICLVEAHNIAKRYLIRNNAVDALKNINITINRGETNAVIGPSGAGKSTLLHLLGLLEAPSSGNMLFDGKDVNELNDHQLTQLRLKNVGFVFQFHHLLPEFTALENVMIPALMNRDDRQTSRERASMLLDKVGLSARISHRPGELSGGEQQRVALARALMNTPALILADEPTGNLDRKSSDAVQELIWQLCADTNAAALLVTHNEEIAKRAKKQWMMLDGSIHRI